jgi:diguanylate cyclase (GGDEF)-like protein/PAS domain S-box-containing protein
MSDASSVNRKPVILIVDDEAFMRTVFQDVLQLAGFSTFAASDGDSALKSIAHLKPDLVLLDLIMPGKDGFETCREIRQLAEANHLPVLVVTGLDDTESIHRAFEAGATDFISKPVKPELLAYRVRYMLRASTTMKNLMNSEASLAYAQQIACLGNWEWDPATGSFSGSRQMAKILGQEQGQLVCSFEEFLATVSPPDRDLVESGIKRAANHQAECSLEFGVVRPDKAVRTVRLLGSRNTAFAGRSHLIVGILQDVTEANQAEARLTMLKEAVDCLPIGITLTDLNGTIVYCNPAEADMHGYLVEDLVGQEVAKFASRDLRRPFMPEKMNNVGLWKRETSNIKKSGEQFPVQLTSIAVRDASGRCLGMVTACEDITSRKDAEKTINSLAYYDILTGLPNRGMFLDRLHQALAMARREGHTVGLLFIDLDNFKDVNDTMGHYYGDKLLQEVAKRLAASVRESDTLARLGGDEFVVVLSSSDAEERAALAAQRMLALFVEPFSIEAEEIHCNVSIGVALCPGDSGDVEGLLKCADTAMYCAKENGKAQYQVYTAEMNQRVMRRVTLEKGLRQGLDKGELVLHYQPKWDLKTNKIVGVEALLRWQSAEFGLVMPSEFIPLAENNGMIVTIGEWVLRTACFQAREWTHDGYAELKVAVNISSQQLKQRNFLEMVEQIIEETGIDPSALELEFTESVMIEATDKIVRTLNALKEMGVQLSIDDFGTGYSCLSNLKHFSIDKVKIDRMFVADVNRSNDDAAIVEAIISMAHSLNLRVVAEGVENVLQLKFLTERGCDQVQGFYLGVPMNSEDLMSNLQQGQPQEGPRVAFGFDGIYPPPAKAKELPEEN